MIRLILLLACFAWPDDCILISGQSNAASTMAGYNYSNAVIRSLGKTSIDSASHMLVDSSVGTASGSPAHLLRGVGAWGMRLAERITIACQCSLFVINGATGGATIALYAPSKSLSTCYGREYWRVNKAGKTGNVKFVYWWQGEAETYTTSLTYLEKFTALYNSWKSDYPNISRVFVVRPKLCSTLSQDTNILAVINDLPNHFSDLSVISVDNIAGWDGCHWYLSGYVTIGDTLYNRLRAISSYPTLPAPVVNPPPLFYKFGGLRGWFYLYDVNGRRVWRGEGRRASGIYFNGSNKSMVTK